MLREPDTVDREPREWYREQEGRLEDLARLVEQGRLPSLRYARDVSGGIPIYDGESCRRWIAEGSACVALQSEWVAVLRDGAGALVLRRACADTTAVDAATAVFESIIRDERSGATGGADHFAKPGANDRIWNAQEKLCLRDPEVFVRYFANPLLMAVCQAWLGPAYQMTSQVNVVRHSVNALVENYRKCRRKAGIEPALGEPRQVLGRNNWCGALWTASRAGKARCYPA